MISRTMKVMEENRNYISKMNGLLIPTLKLRYVI